MKGSKTPRKPSVSEEYIYAQNIAAVPRNEPGVRAKMMARIDPMKRVYVQQLVDIADQVRGTFVGKP
jgi:hypothetical protein